MYTSSAFSKPFQLATATTTEGYSPWLASAHAPIDLRVGDSSDVASHYPMQTQRAAISPIARANPYTAVNSRRIPVAGSLAALGTMAMTGCEATTHANPDGTVTTSYGLSDLGFAVIVAAACVYFVLKRND